LRALLTQAWLESCGTYGYRKLTLDMRDLGEGCGKQQVSLLLKREGLRLQRWYRRRLDKYALKPRVVTPNYLDRQFDRDQPRLTAST